MKLEFSGLNGLLHTALTYLCQDDCVIPGGPALPEGTAVRLELVYPDGDEPLVVNGNSLGLDPGGRGLRLEIQDPAALHQVVMLMAHLHLGPHVARKLLGRFGLVEPSATGQPQASAPIAEALPVTEPPQNAAETIDPPFDERTRLPSVSDEPKVKDPPPMVRPPRLRPPVIRPPRVRPPAAATELPRFGVEEPEAELSQTAIAIDPKLIADLDDLDDDY